MKQIVIIAFLFFVGVCRGQQPTVLSTTSLANPNDDATITKNGNYAVDTNNERQQYVGTWEYNQGGILFQLKIEKVDQVINKIEYSAVTSHYSYCDEIIIRYKLVKNNVVLHNNLSQNISAILNSTNNGFKLGSKIYLIGSILDYTRNVVGSYTIKKVLGTPQKILFNLNKGTYTLKNPGSFHNDGQPLFSIPTGEIEMVKIN